MKCRIAGINRNSIVDGKGIRMTVFMQGCSHNCKGCQNPDTHDFNGGYEADTDEIIDNLKKCKYHQGITLSGGDPFFQPIAATQLANGAHEIGKNVWCYTGYKIEEILEHGTPDQLKLLESVDVLVDGKFIESCKTLNKTFAGSTNQRIIDVKQTLAEGKPVELEL